MDEKERVAKEIKQMTSPAGHAKAAAEQAVTRCYYVKTGIGYKMFSDAMQLSTLLLSLGPRDEITVGTREIDVTNVNLADFFADGGMLYSKKEIK